MEKEKKSDAMKKFPFFTCDELKDKPLDNVSSSIIDIDINKVTYINNKFFFATRKDCKIYVYDYFDK